MERELACGENCEERDEREVKNRSGIVHCGDFHWILTGRLLGPITHGKMCWKLRLSGFFHCPRKRREFICPLRVVMHDRSRDLAIISFSHTLPSPSHGQGLEQTGFSVEGKKARQLNDDSPPSLSEIIMRDLPCTTSHTAINKLVQFFASRKCRDVYKSSSMYTHCKVFFAR